MRIAKSAGGLLPLGATLVAVFFAGEVSAGISGGDVTRSSEGHTSGISGGDILGISGGDVTGISGGDILVASGTGLVLAGPVDSIDTESGVFRSLGQAVMASHDMLAQMRVGDFVAVHGSVVSDGWYYADNVSVTGQQYVPGATAVFVSGLISSVDRMEGTAQMGGLTIDYTPSLGSTDAPAGGMWSFYGTRPSMDGAMISDRAQGIR